MRTLFFAAVLCVLVLPTLLFRSGFVCAFPFAFDLSVRAFAARGVELWCALLRFRTTYVGCIEYNRMFVRRTYEGEKMKLLIHLQREKNIGFKSST